MTTPNDYTGQLLGYLQAWRQFLEQAAGSTQPAAAWPAAAAPWPTPPPMPPAPPGVAAAGLPMPPTAGPLPPGFPGASPAAPAGSTWPYPPAGNPSAEYPTAAYPTAGNPTVGNPTVGPRAARDRPAQPLPGQPAPFGAGATGPGEQPPGSAYSWAGQPAGAGSSGQAESLYSEPGTSLAPLRWWEGQGFVRPEIPEVTQVLRPQDDHPLVFDDPTSGTEHVPADEGGPFHGGPPPPGAPPRGGPALRPGAPALPVVRRPTTGPVQFRWAGRTEITGADPMA